MPTVIRSALSILLVAAFCATVVRAEEPIKPDQAKSAEADAPKKDAPPPVKVGDSAKPVLDKMREAYSKLPGLQMGGTWKVEWEIGTEKGNESAEFTSSFAAPNKFRHETKNDLLFGSTGEKSFAIKQNLYFLDDAAKARVGIDALPKLSASLLKEKNPSLLLAVSDEETPYLAEKATSIDKADDVNVDGKPFTQLKVVTDSGADVTVLIDPATNLMRRWSVDLKRSLTDRGQQDVKTATMTIDYANVKAEAPAGPEAFAWTPPAGAKDAAKMAAAAAGEASDLEGKPAPTFELEDLAGKKVKLEDLKGSVVVLDMWATWCGPCRAGLPILDKVAAARKDKPLKVYAVNWEEDKDAVAAFVKESGLAVPVLLDTTGEVGRTYGADKGIPETIIIGTDGVVKKVMVGLHPQAELEAAIDGVLKGL